MNESQTVSVTNYVMSVLAAFALGLLVAIISFQTLLSNRQSTKIRAMTSNAQRETCPPIDATPEEYQHYMLTGQCE